MPELHKVKAHRTRAQATREASNEEPMRHWLGNTIVDKGAKDAARLHGVHPNSKTSKEVDERLPRFYNKMNPHVFVSSIITKSLLSGLLIHMSTSSVKMCCL